MKVLVTGGAGFIASHIVDLLIDLGHSVAILDNFSTGRQENVNAKAEVYKMDILDDRTIDAFLEFKPEIVIHHAAQIDIQSSLKDPAFDATVNIVGTVKLLELCKKANVKKIIYASSAAVYGNPHYLPVDEKHPIRPLSYYGISKHTPEHYIEVFSEQNGLDFTILRYANVYGTRQDPKGEGGVVSIFIDKIIDKYQPTIFGDGEQTRDFIFVKDVARANIAALDKGSKGIYNIGCCKQTSVKELLTLISKASNVEVVPMYKEARAGDIIHSFLDYTSAKKDLNWEPQYSLRDGLQETCNYYLPHNLNK
ncbi:NAD-dependent epimerase/dehydratase family protein [Paenibacillus sp. MAH-36]|uniref:UDP-glucose 4-epimerase n=1 Tax=Paenibacillus violae TaxID=3077234 RepID=A0ABU3RHE7_9BACL|nr:NAD-dependent epimerase/dehydratase family protein [Paenibacillus sp. PFR10]MDU0203710.1 NAD-dependent epimerase/dehydratase family protein [Paenibacillus sp. PFR10]